jgi:hypothetical protein
MVQAGTNGKILSVFDTVPALVGNNLYLILIGLFALKWLAKKTSWAGDDKISTMLSGFVALVMRGGFTKENVAKYLEEKANVSDRTERKAPAGRDNTTPDSAHLAD